MGLRPRLSADAAFAAYSNPGLAPRDYSMNPVPLGIVFVFSILHRFLGEPSAYRLRWAPPGPFEIEHQGGLLPPPSRLGGTIPFSMGLRPRLSADAAFAAYSNPGLAPRDYSMNPVPLGIVFVFSILHRFLGEPSAYRLRWAPPGPFEIEHQGGLLPPPSRLGGTIPFSMGLRPRLSADAAFAAFWNPGLAARGINI